MKYWLVILRSIGAALTEHETRPLAMMALGTTLLVTLMFVRPILCGCRWSSSLKFYKSTRTHYAASLLLKGKLKPGAVVNGFFSSLFSS
jgi:hypothetical protein